jgi:hypothetical protein
VSELTRNPHRPLSSAWEAWNGGWHAGFNDCVRQDDRDRDAIADRNGNRRNNEDWFGPKDESSGAKQSPNPSSPPSRTDNDQR